MLDGSNLNPKRVHGCRGFRVGVLGLGFRVVGVAGALIFLPAAVVKAHLSALRHDGASGGVIFVDCRSAAYNSVARELLAATPAERADIAWLQERARRLFSNERDQARFALLVV